MLQGSPDIVIALAGNKFDLAQKNRQVDTEVTFCCLVYVMCSLCVCVCCSWHHSLHLLVLIDCCDVCICMYVCVFVYIYVMYANCVYVCMRVCICVYVYMCVYLCICVCVTPCIWCMTYDVWCMMYDVWCMMYDVWCMMYDVWCMMYDVWYMMYDVWCMMYDVWCMRCMMYDVQEAKAYADENGIFFMETSAKTNHNVKELFVAIARKLPEKVAQPNKNGVISDFGQKPVKSKDGCCS